jgi:hypothetical protein
MAPTAYLCATAACGDAFERCSRASVPVILTAAFSGGLLVPPADYPAGFPFLAGGIPQDVGPVGPVQTLILTYAGTPEEITTVLRNELKRQGWTVQSEERSAETTAWRLQTGRSGVAVSASIYGMNSKTVLQIIY